LEFSILLLLRPQSTDGGREGERGVARERKGEEEKVVEEVYRQAA